MKALVTGAAGFIGSTLAERLLADGAEVVGIDCFTDYYPRAMKERNLAPLRQRPGFSFVESTIQAADLRGLLSDRTHVFHLAAQAGVRKSWGRDFAVYTVNNIEATQVLLEATASAAPSLERFVYASSSSVYGDERGDSDARRCAPATGIALRGVEARCRTALLSVSRELRRADRLAALFHRVRTSTAPRHGLPSISCAPQQPASR